MKQENRIQKIPQMLHGGDYNPDQWLDRPDILLKDVELMKKANVNCVSLGIFSWAKLEPVEGNYDLDWLEEIISRLYENGIYTILATPSGATPVWMADKYEQVRRVSSSLIRELKGNRHNHCYTSPIYREKIWKMNQLLAKRFSNHPAVILWHLSNEYGGECYCPLCQQAFREWLKEKYKSIDSLNKAWWTDFWSRHYDDFSQIEAPVPSGERCIHGLNLDWKRFVTYQTVDFAKWERDSVKSINPNIPVTVNMMGTYDGINYFKFKDIIDITSWDSYPCWHGLESEAQTGQKAAFSHDLMRSIKREPFLLMESSPSATNWQPISKLRRPRTLCFVQASKSTMRPVFLDYESKSKIVGWHSLCRNGRMNTEKQIAKQKENKNGSKNDWQLYRCATKGKRPHAKGFGGEIKCIRQVGQSMGTG